MTPPNLPRPTDAEMAILQVLWGAGSSTVREVLEALNGVPGATRVGYTTVLKLLQIMTKKGLVERDDAGRRHVFRAARGRERTERQLVDDLMARAFAGSAGRLALQALRAGEVSAEERSEIRALLDEIEADGG